MASQEVSVVRNLIRCVIVLSVTVAVLAGAYLILFFAPSQDSFEGVIFASLEPVDIKSVSVQNESGSFRFYFDFEEGGYVTDDIPPQIVDVDKLIDFLSNSAQIAALRTVTSGGDLKDFGLEPPYAIAQIEFFDEEPLRISIGAMERISGHFYATVEGYDDVFIISKVIAAQFLLPKTQIISPFVTPPLAVTSPLSAIRNITFTGGGLDSPVTIYATAGADKNIALAAMSFGAATHIVHRVATYQLDQAYGIQILGSLFEITAVDILGYGFNDEEIASFGFDEPYMAIDYNMVNGVGAEERQMSLRFVDAGGGYFYAMLEGTGAVYLIERKPFLDIEYEKLLLRWFLTPFLMDLSSVTVEYPGSSFRFDIDASDPRNPAVYYDGEALDIDLFHTFFRLITSAGHDGAYLGALSQPVEEQPQLTITYDYLDPDKKPDVMTLFPGGVRRVNVFVNGLGEFAMRDMFVSRVREGALSLISGNPVEENW